MGGGYWDLVDPVWDEIDIDSPEVFLETFAKAPIEAKSLFAAHFCQSEICNGGFGQFFFNSTGVLAPEAVQAFRAIGQPQIALLIETAMRMLGLPYPRDREKRQATFDALPAGVWDDVDEQFFALISSEAGGFEQAADAYAARVKY